MRPKKIIGEVAEWLKAPAWKACKRETVSRVRIPLSPPFFKKVKSNNIHIQLKRVLNKFYESDNLPLRAVEGD